MIANRWTDCGRRRKGKTLNKTLKLGEYPEKRCWLELVGGPFRQKKRAGELVTDVAASAWSWNGCGSTEGDSHGSWSE